MNQVAQTAVGHLITRALLSPEAVGPEAFNAVPSKVIEALPDHLRLAWDCVSADVRMHGSADKERVKAAANGASETLVKYLAELMGGDVPVDVSEILLNIQRAAVAESVRPRSAGPTSADLAEKYLEIRGEAIRFWRGSFYRWTGAHYEELPASDLAADAIRFLQGTENRRSAGTRAAGEILANVKAITFIPSNVEPPIFILPEGLQPAPRNLIPMVGGNFDVEKYLTGKDAALSPHTPSLFGLHSLPYSYIPTAECPMFHEVMQQNLPDPEYRAFLQEWFGLNLISDSPFEAFMIYTGEAGTGKTVACTVQSTMLGPASVSAIPLEALNPVRTFPLAALVGKLANVTEEIGECDKAAEGLLKQLVTGSPVTIERK